MRQTHVNALAERYSQDRVKQASSHMKSIFDEAAGQQFLIGDPNRKMRIPKNLRPKDNPGLSWNEIGSIQAMTVRRDRLLPMLNPTDALLRGELFALRWRFVEPDGLYGAGGRLAACVEARAMGQGRSPRSGRCRQRAGSKLSFPAGFAPAALPIWPAPNLRARVRCWNRRPARH